jgi:uncharacterized repeat protein (TIGR03803 family)
MTDYGEGGIMKRIFITPFAFALAATVLLQVPVQADTEPRAYTVLHSFQDDGIDGLGPWAGLIDVGGTLYGTTLEGGPNCEVGGGCGTVFSINPTTGATSILYYFRGVNYGDGKYPASGVIYVDGLLYGTTISGGSSNLGTIFAVDPTTGAETFRYSFRENTGDGYWPWAGLLNVKGTLYGTTSTGAGSTSWGTVFAFNPKTGKEKTIYAFKNNNSDACFPYASLIRFNGKLYGTTDAGATLDLPTVFSIDLKTHAEQLVFQFTNRAQGAVVNQSLVESNGLLYGTAQLGGAHDYGDVFAVDPNTGMQTVLYSFCNQPSCSDGDRPFAAVIVKKGILYGTTGDGGDTAGCNDGSGGGVVYSLDPNTGVETVLHTFECAPNDGQGSQAPLLFVGTELYGTTIGGGTGVGGDCPVGRGCGTVFKLRR